MESYPPPIRRAIPLSDTEPPAPAFADRRMRLRAIGVLLIVVGAMAGCMGLLAPLVLFMPASSAADRPPTASIVLALAVYVAVGIIFVWTGIGSVRLRRWVRPIALTIGWVWLLTGVIMEGMLIWIGPAAMQKIMKASMEPQEARGPVSPDALGSAAWTMTAILIAVLCILLPGVLVWGYQGKDVRRTLEHFDPRLRWTDRCPTKVLGLVIAMGVSAAGMLMMLPYAVMPLFTVVLTGPAAVGAILAAAALLAALTWGLYRLKPLAWWGTLAATLAGTAAMLVFYSGPWERVEPLYRATSGSPKQLEVVRSSFEATRLPTQASSVLFAVVLIVYLLVVYKHFRRRPAPAEPAE